MEFPDGSLPGLENPGLLRGPQGELNDFFSTAVSNNMPFFSSSNNNLCMIEMFLKCKIIFTNNLEFVEKKIFATLFQKLLLNKIKIFH